MCGDTDLDHLLAVRPLSKLFNLCTPCFPHLQNGHNNDSDII